MELLFVYLWLKLNTIITVSILGAIALVLTRFGFVLARSDCRFTETAAFDAKFGKIRSRMIPAAIFLAAVAIFTPSKMDMAILVGASVAVDVAKSPEGVKIGALLRGKANELLDEQLKELTKPAK